LSLVCYAIFAWLLPRHVMSLAGLVTLGCYRHCWRHCYCLFVVSCQLSLAAHQNYVALVVATIVVIAQFSSGWRHAFTMPVCHCLSVIINTCSLAGSIGLSAPFAMSRHWSLCRHAGHRHCRAPSLPRPSLTSRHRLPYAPPHCCLLRNTGHWPRHWRHCLVACFVGFHWLVFGHY